MKRFDEIKKMYNEQKHLKQINYEETKDYEIESLKFKNKGLCKQIDNYRYFPERLKKKFVN